MKKLIVALMAVMLVFCFTADYSIEKKVVDTRTVAERVSETVIIVGNSTGVVVYSEIGRTLVLTARHNIEDVIDEIECPECLENIDIGLIVQILIGNNLLEIPMQFDVIDFDESKKRDLAIIEINTVSPLEFAIISDRNLRLGEDIYTVSNPQYIFRSLKKGIVGSIYRISRGVPAIEISGGVIYGSSGGGVFTMDGKLAGIMFSVKVLESDHCYELYDENGKLVGERCIQIPLPYIGFAIRTDVIKEFLLEGKFKEDFKYLEVGKHE